MNKFCIFILIGETVWKYILIMSYSYVNIFVFDLHDFLIRFLVKTIKLLLEEENIARNLKKSPRTGDEIEPEVARLFSTFHTAWPREMFFPQEFSELTKLYFDIHDED